MRKKGPMTDNLTRVVADAQQEIEDLCPHEADEHAEGCCDVCDLTFAAVSVLDDLAAALAPVIEARVREARADAWDEGFQAATDETPTGYAPGWSDEDNPYRGEAPYPRPARLRKLKGERNGKCNS
jgi:hypothetical protein